MYSTLHEADISKFVDIVDARVQEFYPNTNLKRIRTNYELHNLYVIFTICTLRTPLFTTFFKNFLLIYNKVLNYLGSNTITTITFCIYN